MAAHLGLPLAADVISFDIGDAVTDRHPVYIGKAIATLRLEGTPALLSLRPGATGAADQPRTARVERISPASDPAAARVVVTEIGSRGGAKLDLAEAPVVVAGGRGLKAAEHFALVSCLQRPFSYRP